MRWMVLLLMAAALSGCAGDDGTDDLTLDSDGDGFSDADENAAGSDPHDASSVPLVRMADDLTFSDSGLIVGGTDGAGVAGPCGQVSPLGTVAFEWTIAAPAGTEGASVTEMVFIATYPPTMPEGDIAVFDPDGNELTAPTTMTIPPAPQDRVAVEGDHPTGTYRIEVRGCAGAGEIVLDATAKVSYLAPATPATAPDA